MHICEYVRTTTTAPVTGGVGQIIEKSSSPTLSRAWIASKSMSACSSVSLTSCTHPGLCTCVCVCVCVCMCVCVNVCGGRGEGRRWENESRKVSKVGCWKTISVSVVRWLTNVQTVHTTHQLPIIASQLLTYVRSYLPCEAVNGFVCVITRLKFPW